MNSKIIPPYPENTLSPLLNGSDIGDLPIMGVPLCEYMKAYLSSYGISVSDGLDFDSEGLILAEGNLLTNTDLSSAIYAHKERGADITAVLRYASESSRGNLVIADANGYITGISDTGYHFDPSFCETEGLYILSGSACKFINEINPAFNGRELINSALKSGLNIFGHISGAYSISISSVDDFKRCHSDILGGRLKVRLNAKEIKDGFWLESGAELESDVSIETPVYISAGCHIERGAKIEGGSYIGKGSIVRSNARISHAVIGKGCNISANSSVIGGILSDSVSIGAGSSVMENTVIGSGCRIEPDCLIKTGVKIWPNKRILQGTRLSDNLVWGSVGTEHLFRNGKICGEINIDVTPEFMAKLGSAFGTMFNGRAVGMSFDSSPICSVLASALSAGIISSGAQLYSFGEQTLPITRSCVRYHKLSASIHINIAGGNGFFYPEIEFLEDDGSVFSTENEKILESIFFNNVFFRAEVKNLKEHIILNDSKLHYVQNILNKLKSTSFSMSMELRTRSEGVSDVLEILLGALEKRVSLGSVKEFSGDIAESGQEITLYSRDGKIIDSNKLLGIVATILTEHFGHESIVLPVSVSERLEDYIIGLGGKIIYSGVSEREFIKKMLRHNLYEQVPLCFDGAYLAVILLDYLNYNQKSFSHLLDSIPDTSRIETEVECSNTKKADIIKQLQDKYKENRLDMTDGIKIYRSNGWVLVIPERYRHCVKIITEGVDMETAEEISAIFTNQIKKLAKPE